MSLSNHIDKELAGNLRTLLLTFLTVCIVLFGLYYIGMELKRTYHEDSLRIDAATQEADAICGLTNEHAVFTEGVSEFICKPGRRYRL